MPEPHAPDPSAAQPASSAGTGERRRNRSDSRRGRRSEQRPERDPAAEEARRQRRRSLVPAVTYPAELPISERREELAAAIAAHQVVVVAGETGSGKSTQLPKICLELGRGIDGFIGHTQPRRVAARTIAERVASELGSEVGGAVGYTVRFNDQVGDDTFIKVMTDGILLAELQRDQLLRRYDTIIVDEAHERSLNIDFLLGYLHQLLPKRPDLKVIITSATIDTSRFAAHFRDAPVIEVSGRTFPVEIRYRPYGELIAAEEGDDVLDDDRDQVQAIGDAVDELRREGPGDILVFLSGEREIRDTAEALAKRDLPDTEILPLYARLSSAEQHRVFQPHRGRRVVLATNVAETSITVPGVRYVIDAGTARISRYSHRLKVQRLPIEAVSQASANQRSGRCGRVAPGIAIRLYSQEDFESRPEFTDPEILRTNLASVILQMTNLGLGDVAAFPFLDPPDHRAVRDGIALLDELGALDHDPDADRRRLTKIGRQLVQLPIDPRLGRMVLEADRHGCVHEVTVIAAALSIQDPRERPQDKQQAADELHRRFKVPGSDLLSLVKLWEHLEDRRQELTGNRFRRECKAEFLNYLRVREWRDLQRQVAQAARKLGLRTNDQRADADAVHRALLAGLLSQVGVKDRETREFRGARNSRFQLAHSSALAKKPPAWVMAAELVETNRLWGRNAAAIRPEWLEPLAGHLVKRSYGDPRWDERSGRAVTTEKVTLYGLPIVTGRTVGYDKVDVAEARELFVDHALVRGEWETEHRFRAANEAALAEAQELGERLRRSDLFTHDSALFAFYERRIGPEVTSGRHFDRWWKQVQRAHPDLLTLTVEDLVGGEDGLDLRAYPDTWAQGDLRLPLTYRYEPGHTLDGVTVHIPLAVLNRVEPWDFDWQIPGYRTELVTALVGTLPKTIRRLLSPLAESAARAAEALVWQDVPITEALAEVLTELAGQRVRPGDLDPTKLPAHLRVTFAVDDGTQVVAVGKDLDAVKALVSGQVRRAIAEATPEIERTGLVRWDFGDLPRVVRSSVDGMEVEGFPALLDEGESVAIKVFSKPRIAERIMAGGLRRLVLLNVPVGVRGVEKEIPNRVRLGLAALPELTLGKLLRDAIGASANTVIAAHADPDGLVWTQEGFDRVLAGARAELRSTTSTTLRGAGDVVVAAAEIEHRLTQLTSPTVADSVADARAHLDRLVRPGFIATAGTARLVDVGRYLRGLTWRLDKLTEAPARDRQRLAEVAGVERYYRQLLGALTASQVTPRVIACGWSLEELRLSVFAQSVGVKGSVSVKRIRREIDDLFAGNLD